MIRHIVLLSRKMINETLPHLLYHKVILPTSSVDNDIQTNNYEFQTAFCESAVGLAFLRFYETIVFNAS
jgi:hypothetical protein